MALEYPCRTCTLVERPNECRSRKCKHWRMWFKDEWKKFNNYYERCMKVKVKCNGEE